MSANYSLALINPNVKDSASNVVYVDLAGGNTLHCVVGNNFGFDRQIGGASAGKHVVLQISDNIIDAAAAGKIAAASPWKVDSYSLPQNGDRHFTFNLLPPEGGILLPKTGTLTISLVGLAPSQAGVAQVRLHYQFDTFTSNDLDVSASLSSLAACKPGLPSLIGDTGALRLSIYVNGGAASNPIMVSAAPVTTTTAVENSLRLNLLFQHAASAVAQSASDANLVNKWDPSHPPSFRIFFPYFGASEKLSARLDLTDSLKESDAGYNPLTSAWNIRGTLDPNHPAITQNDFWQITLDPNAPDPVWLITPRSSNTHLMTAVEGSNSEPGPFLDLYLLSIVSALPIDLINPETILFFQWNNFPGFNDGLAAFPLQKTELTIASFSAALRRTNSGNFVSFQWDTTGSYCLLSSDDNHLRPSTLNDGEHLQAVTEIQPLRSFYTLTAMGQDGVSSVSRTVTVRWEVNTELTSTQIPGALSMQVSPDGKLLLVTTQDPLGIRLFDPNTLQPLPAQLLASPDGSAPYIYRVSPNSETVYAVTSGGRVYSYNLQTQTANPGSGKMIPDGTLPYADLSPDGTQFVVITNKREFEVNGKKHVIGANRMHILHTYNLEESQGSPQPLPDATWSFRIGTKTGTKTERLYISTEKELIIMDTPIHDATKYDRIDIKAISLLAISDRESVLCGLSLQSVTPTFTFALSSVDTSTLRIITQQHVNFGFHPIFFLLGAPFAALALSRDGNVLFFIGIETESLKGHKFVTRFSAFDPRTLQELSWSPLKFDAFLPIDLSMAYDGSRLFVLTVEHLPTQNLSSQNLSAQTQATGKLEATVYAVDPEFVQSR